MAIGERVKKVRESFNLTQDDFTNKLGLIKKRSTIADIERGRIYPNPKIVENLHLKFNINLNWLICGSGKMKLELQDLEDINEVRDKYEQYKGKYMDSLEKLSKLYEEMDKLRHELESKK